MLFCTGMAPFPTPLSADAGNVALGTDAVLYAGGVVFKGGGVADCVSRGLEPERSVWALLVALDTSFAAVAIVVAEILMGRGVVVVYTRRFRQLCSPLVGLEVCSPSGKSPVLPF